MRIYRFSGIFFYILAVFNVCMASFLSGCSTHKITTLMPTPVIYSNSIVDPFAHLDSTHKSTRTDIFYATNRRRSLDEGKVQYGNAKESFLYLGQATVRMGRQEENWEDIYTFSRSAEYTEPVPVVLEDVVETSTFQPNVDYSGGELPPRLQTFVDAVNTQLDSALDKEIMVYVHGTKVDFANSAILTAEIDHFAGRDFVALSFAWPSHQNILSYMIGTDVRRALDSTEALSGLLVFLAGRTSAKQINILYYSAGGKIVTRALFDIRQNNSHLDAINLRKKFRIGSVVFAAIDVDVDIFVERINGISELCEQVVLTVTDDDNALRAARTFMGGEVRAGSAQISILIR